MATLPIIPQTTRVSTQTSQPGERAPSSPPRRLHSDLHPLQSYLSFIQGVGRVDPEGNLLAPYSDAKLPPLPASARDTIEIFLKKPRPLPRHLLEWSIQGLYQKLFAYFSKMFRGTQSHLFGVYPLIGKEYWQKTICEGLMIDDLTAQTKPEMWAFCSKSFSHELRFILPQRFNGADSQQTFNRFLDLCYYFLALREVGESFFGEELREFGYLSSIQPDTPGLSQRHIDLKKRIESLRKVIPADMTTTSLKLPFLTIRFTFEEKQDDISLALNGDHFELACGSPPMRVLHNHLLNCLTGNTLGHLWAHLTEFGQPLHPPEIDPAVDLHLSFQEGSERVAPDVDHFIAYYFNVLAQLGPRRVDFKLPITKIGPEAHRTPLGAFLYHHLNGHLFERVSSVLQIVYGLRLYICSENDTSSPRLTPSGALEIPIGSGYVVIPLQLEKSLLQLYDWIQTDRGSIQCLTDCLKMAFPSSHLVSLPRNNPPVLQEGLLDEIEKALPPEVQFLWYTALRTAGWKKVGEDDVLRLPTLCTDAERMRHLEGVYRNSPYFPLFKTIQEPAETFSVLLLCKDQKIVQGIWRACLALDPPLCAEILNRLVDQFDLPTLSLVLARVSELSSDRSSLPREDRISLMEKYLSRLSKEEQTPQLSETRQRLQNYLLTAYEENLDTDPFLLWRALRQSGTKRRIFHLIKIYQAVIRSGNKWNHYTEVAEEFLAAEHLTNVTPEFMEWLAAGLLQEDKIELLTSVACRMPPSKDDHPFLLKLLEELLDRNNPKSYPKVLELKGRIVGEKVDGSHFISCLLRCYPLMPSEAVMEDMTQHFAIFRQHERLHALFPIIRILLQETSGDQYWTKFIELFKRLKNENSLTEFVLEILEQIHTVAPQQVFKRDFSKFAAKLSKEQKVRLGRILIGVVERSKSREWITVFLPQSTYLTASDWLLSLIRTEETWKFYAKNYFIFTRGDPVNHEPIFWLAAHLYNDPNPTLVPELQRVALSTSEASNRSSRQEWLKLFAGIAACSPVRSNPLFNRLLALAVGDERPFFRHCSGLPKDPMQKLLRAYVATGAMDVPLRQEVVEYDAFIATLSGQPATSQLEHAWGLWIKSHPVEKITANDVRKWADALRYCFQSKNSTAALFDTHLLDILGCILTQLGNRELVLEYFTLAINFCWDEKMKPSQKRLVLIHATIRSEVIRKIVGEDPVQALPHITQARFAILLCIKDVALFNQIECFSSIFRHEPLQKKFNQVLIEQFCVLACVPDDNILRIRIYDWLENSITQTTLNWNQVGQILRLLRIFVKERNFHRIFTQWKMYLAIQKHEIEGVPKTLVSCPEIKLNMVLGFEAPTDLFLNATSFLVKDFLSQKFNFTIKQDVLFSLASMVEDFEISFFLANPAGAVRLRELWMVLILATLKEIPKLPDYDLSKATPQFMYWYGSNVSCSLLAIVLRGMKRLFPEFMKKPSDQTELKEALTGFTDGLPSILCVAQYNDPILEEVRCMIRIFPDFFNLYASSPRTYNDHWGNLLVNFITGIYMATSQHLPKMLRFGIQIFTEYTHTDNGENSNRMKAVAFHSSKFLDFFLSGAHLEILPPAELEVLFQGLSESSVTNAIDECMSSLLAVNTDHIWTLLRILRFTRPYGPKFLRPLYKLIHETIPKMAPKLRDPDCPELHLLFVIRFGWTILAFIEKCKQFPEMRDLHDQLFIDFRAIVGDIEEQLPKITHPKLIIKDHTFNLIYEFLDLYREALPLYQNSERTVRQFTALVFSPIKDSESYITYSKILFALIQKSDPATLSIIRSAITIPPDSPIKSHLEGLLKILDAKIGKK